MSLNRSKSLTKAQKALQKGKTEEAIAAFLEVLQDDPTDVRTMLKIGDLQAKISDVQGACLMYQKVGEHYAKDGFYLKAVAVYKQVLKLDPGLLVVYQKLAELYQHLGLVSEAIKQYQVVVKQYESLGLIRESLDVLKKISDLEPDNVTSKIKLAELYFKEGHRNEAETQFLLLTQKLKTDGHHSELNRVYDRMIALGLSSVETELGLAETFLEQNDARRALIHLQKLFQRDPRNIRVLETLARCFTEIDQKEKAKSVYSEIMSILDQEGKPEEKNKYAAKLRALSVLAQPVAEKLGEQPAMDQVAAPTHEGTTQPPGSTYQKTLDEVTVFLQYGLTSKAYDILEPILHKEFGDAPLRRKFIDVCQALNQVVKAHQMYQSLEARAYESNDSALHGALCEEMKTLGLTPQFGPMGEHAPTEPPPADAQTQPFDTTEVADITLDLSSLDDVEIVDDDPSDVDGLHKTDTSPNVETSTPQAADIEVGDIAFEVSGDYFNDTASPSEEDTQDIPMSSLGDIDVLPDMVFQQENTLAHDFESDLGESAPIVSGNDPFVEDEPLSQEPALVDEPMLSPSSEADFKPAPLLDPHQVEMETAAFLLERGLVQDAKDIYIKIIMKDRGFEPALEALKNLSVASVQLATSPTQTVTQPPPPLPALQDPQDSHLEHDLAAQAVTQAPSESQAPASSNELSGEQPQTGGDFFDLGAALDEELGALDEFLQGDPAAKETILSPSEVISEFKKGVAKTVAKDDYETHYSLGIAYKEMGLLDEALAEFKLARGGAAMEVDAASMMGLTLIQKRDYVEAAKTYKEALSRMLPTHPNYVGMMYELAGVFRALDRLDESKEAYQRVVDLDPQFRNAAELMRELDLQLDQVPPPPLDPERQPTQSNAEPLEARRASSPAELDESRNESLEMKQKRNKVSFV